MQLSSRKSQLVVGIIGGLFLSVLTVIGYSGLRPVPVSAQAAPPRPLRVFAYNTASGDMSRLATFIIANQIDVALLSEMNNWPAYKDASPDAKDQGVDLQQQLQAKGYHMQLWHTPMDGKNGRKLFGQVILTRYTALPNSFLDQPYPNDETRWIPSVQIQSPLGPLRVLSMHTQYGSNTCKQLQFIDQYIKSLIPTNRRMIAGGDFNDFACGDTWREMMGDYQDWCTHRIDHIISPKDNDFKLVACQKLDPGISDHFAVMADLLLKDGLAYPNPLPQLVTGPGISPTPTSVPLVGDLNRDGVVNRTDINLLVAKIGSENCAVNLEGTCQIDLYDFNKLFQHVTSL